MRRLVFFNFLIWTAFSFLQYSNIANASCALQFFSGKAYDLNTQKLLYQENYQRFWNDDHLTRDQVEYRDTQNFVFAVKAVLYNSGFSQPSFKLMDRRSHYFEAAEINDKTTKIWYQVPGKEKITESILSLPENAVHDAGFNELVQKNWLELQKGNVVSMQFLAPSRAIYLGFEITPAAKQVAGKLIVSLGATNKIFKWAIGQIDLTYDAATQQLLTFQGLTNIKNNDKKNIRARIDYVYQEKQAITCPKNLDEPLILLTFKD